ncbi:MAG: phage tail protein [Methylobacter sp.]|nr:MAG: phage tail protein [Methylobacter sp.]PPD03364.1 MAG: phage tail protein [Methylobacter sp.]PPD23597.1 MAG: phage tail protein [Methylobacter sp.]
MSEPFVGEIRPFSFGYAPKGWLTCDGQILNISQFQALFSLLGTQYGGDGRTTFGLPDLRGRAGMDVSSTHLQGEKGGVESVSLTAQQMPMHSHSVNANSNAGNKASPEGNFWAVNSNGYSLFSTAGAVTMAANAVGSAGGGQAHSNMQPYQVINYCIAIQGVYPSRS